MKKTTSYRAAQRRCRGRRKAAFKKCVKANYRAKRSSSRRRGHRKNPARVAAGHRLAAMMRQRRMGMFDRGAYGVTAAEPRVSSGLLGLFGW